MFSPQCGKENEAGARFCGDCGATIADPMPAPSPTPVQSAEPLRTVTPGAAGEVVPPGVKWGVLGVSVLLPVVGLVMGLYYWIKAESPDKVATGKLWFFGALALSVVYSLLSSAQQY